MKAVTVWLDGQQERDLAAFCAFLAKQTGKPVTEETALQAILAGAVAAMKTRGQGTTWPP